MKTDISKYNFLIKNKPDFPYLHFHIEVKIYFQNPKMILFRKDGLSSKKGFLL